MTEPSDLGRVLLHTVQDLAVLTRRVEGLESAASDVTDVRERLADLPSGGDLSSVFAELSGHLQDLAGRLAALEAVVAPDDPERGKVWDWTRMEGPAREHAWQQLTTWVRDVLGDVYRCLGSPNGDVTDLSGGKDDMRAAKVPACWAKHSDLILELSWLCQEWQRVMSGNDPAKVGDWHDRYLHGFRRRLRDSSAGDCLADGHRDPARPRY